MGLEVFEKSLGLDPNDPIVTFVLFIGTSATLWYRCCFLFFFYFLFASYVSYITSFFRGVRIGVSKAYFPKGVGRTSGFYD